MTTPRDALFVDALSGSDGTAEVAPPPWHDERFGDPLAASPAEPKAAAMPVVSLPVVELAPPDPRKWMSHLAEQEQAAAPQRVATRPGQPAPAGYPAPQRPGRQPQGAQYAARPGAPSVVPGSWPPPVPGSVPRGGGQRYAVRQSSGPQRPVPAQRAVPAPRPGQAPRTAVIPRSAQLQRSRGATAQQNASANQPGRVAPRTRKKSGGGWTLLFVLIIFLVFSGLGREAIDALLEILNR